MNRPYKSLDNMGAGRNIWTILKMTRWILKSVEAFYNDYNK